MLKSGAADTVTESVFLSWLKALLTSVSDAVRRGKGRGGKGQKVRQQEGQTGRQTDVLREVVGRC